MPPQFIQVGNKIINVSHIVEVDLNPKWTKNNIVIVLDIHGGDGHQFKDQEADSVRRYFSQVSWIMRLD